MKKTKIIKEGADAKAKKKAMREIDICIQENVMDSL